MYTQESLKEALFAITSVLHKCEKVLEKLKPGTSSHTLTTRRIAAFQTAISLMEEKMEVISMADKQEVIFPMEQEGKK